ncbi:hypothetical protein ACN6LC_003727 [Streptomyces violaceoruber]|uniref:hypothetical protein n=1 Tax=Streptomyces violaceoruber TaxID=1935 RepID=UPI00403D3F68
MTGRQEGVGGAARGISSPIVWDTEENLRTTQWRSGIIRNSATEQEVWVNDAFRDSWSLDEELREALVDEFGAAASLFDAVFDNHQLFTREGLHSINACDGQPIHLEGCQPTVAASAKTEDVA